MSRGTHHNALSRARQRTREEAQFKRHWLADEAERRKGLVLCSICSRFFRPNSAEVGICECPSCGKLVARVKAKLTPDEFDKITIKIRDSPKEFTSSISGPPGILDKLKIGLIVRRG